MKIKTHLFLMGLLLSILPMGLVSIMLITFYNNELDKVAVDNLSSITSAQANIIDNFFYDCDVNMSTLSDYDMLHQLLQRSGPEDNLYRNQKAIMEEIFRVQKEKRSYLYSITALDTQFRIIACTEPVEEDGTVFLRDNPTIEEMGREIWFSDIQEVGERGVRERSLIAIKGVYNWREEHIGYLVKEISLEFFENIRAGNKLIQNGTIYILDGKGGLISAGTEENSLEGFVLGDEERNGFTEAWSNRDRSQDVGIIRYEAAGKKYLSSYGGFRNSDWHIISSVCLDSIKRARENYTAVLVLAGIVTVLLVIAVNLMMHRMIAAPIEKMIETFNEIREKKDFSKRIKGIRHNEIGQIASGVNILLEDIENTLSHQKKRLVILKERAERDPLTGLFNCSAFNEVLSVNIDNAHVNREILACVLVDIDDFKSFNTRFGHGVGDRVIRFVADLMRELSADTAGRIGGDEFAMCLCGFASEQEARTTMEEFSRRLIEGSDISGDGSVVSVPCSIGVVLLQDHVAPSVEEVLEKADKAMYQVKNSTKKDFCIVLEQEDNRT